MEFSVGDAVIYGGSGVCRIEKIDNISFFHERPQKHYVLVPLFVKQPTTVYVPFNNEMLVSKIQPIMTKDEALKLIKEVKNNDFEWIEERNVRKDKFLSILTTGTRKEIVDLIGVIVKRREELLNEGKTLNMQDEKILMDAERRMTVELAVAIGVEPEDIRKMIAEELGK